MAAIHFSDGNDRQQQLWNTMSLSEPAALLEALHRQERPCLTSDNVSVCFRIVGTSAWEQSAWAVATEAPCADVPVVAAEVQPATTSAQFEPAEQLISFLQEFAIRSVLCPSGLAGNSPFVHLQFFSP